MPSPAGTTRRNEELIVQWERVLWSNQAGDFVIGRTSKGSVLGPAAPSDFTQGMTYRLFGHYEENDRFGRQFRFKDFVKTIPHSDTGVVQYLVKTCPGCSIGTMTARMIVDKFGADKAVQMLRSSPEDVAREIPRLSAEHAKQASLLLLQDAHQAEAKIELVSLLGNRGFPLNLPTEAIKRYGTSAAKVIKENPFRLMLDGFSGCGFLRTDRLYCELGLPKDSIDRMMFCAWYVIGQESGSVWVPREHVQREMAGLISVPFKMEQVIEHGITQDWLAMRERDGKEFLSRHADDAIEAALAEKIAEMSHSGKDVREPMVIAEDDGAPF